MSKGGLGKGLGALIPVGTVKEDVDNPIKSSMVPIDKIEPNPYQPRLVMNEEELMQLADSIREHGIIQPLILTRNSKDISRYYLIAGERRLRASKMAGLVEVPAIIKESSPEQMLEWALIENIQRKDLGPIEEAQAFVHLQNSFGLGPVEIAKKVGLSRSAVSNKIRLLALHPDIQQMLYDGTLTEGHARTLLGIKDQEVQKNAASIVVKKQMSVRETELLVRKINTNTGISARMSKNETLMRYKKYLDRFVEKTGLPAKIYTSSKGLRFVVNIKQEKDYYDLMNKILDN